MMNKEEERKIIDQALSKLKETEEKTGHEVMLTLGVANLLTIYTLFGCLKVNPYLI